MTNENNEVMLFSNDELNVKVRTIINPDGSISINAEDTAKGFGWTQEKNGKIYVKWERINNFCKEFGFSPLVGKDDYIPESLFYRLGMKANNSVADKFQNWLAMEVIPSIRKTGGYVNNDELFIQTYFPFADEQTKSLLSTTLSTVRKQNEIIHKQQEEIEYKQEVINGLTDNIDIYKKKDVINRICRKRHENYANRYKELYKCFRENYHIDLEARCEGFNIKQPKKKDKLSTIKYAENFGHIDDLYSCCVKLYESEVKEILEELNELHA